jgi:transcriptional regulator with AAA-type ATPase domain
MPELRLTDDAVSYLENYSFPGNIRQLRNLVEQMTVVSRIGNQFCEISRIYPDERQLPAVVQKNSAETPGQISVLRNYV